jgi:hypothetical protein
VLELNFLLRAGHGAHGYNRSYLGGGGKSIVGEGQLRQKKKKQGPISKNKVGMVVSNPSNA